MARTAATGIQDFARLRSQNYFYVDKTDFIREWWENGDAVTLITRPRRFGKSLTLSTVECFFSPAYSGSSSLFEGLSIWKNEHFRKLQGTVPVISLTFGYIKPNSYQEAVSGITGCLIDLYNGFSQLKASESLTEADRDNFSAVRRSMDASDTKLALRRLCEMLYRHYGVKPIVLIDEYDTPLQAAWTNGYWDDLVGFMRDMLDATLKENPFLERGLLTGITRVAKESLFSGLNNLEVITTTSRKYMTSFGFTESEVRDALAEFGRIQAEHDVQDMYDGFTFGTEHGIYNPWSITKFLASGELKAWWTDSSSNDLVEELIRKGHPGLKEDMKTLLEGGIVAREVEEQVEFFLLDKNPSAVWGLFLASGYVRIHGFDPAHDVYELELTNGEVRRMLFQRLAKWFSSVEYEYDYFIKALLCGDIKTLNKTMNAMSLAMFSSFDTAGGSGNNEPERFYHGFVLGLLARLRGRFHITSNRESGYGRYDVCIEPLDRENDPAVIIEFKVHDSDEEHGLADTVNAALRQIDERKYEAELTGKGIPNARIHKYGFAFHGKKVLIGHSPYQP